MIKILLECFGFIKQLIGTTDKKDFMSKNMNVLKNCLIILLAILLIIMMGMYAMNLINKTPTNIILPNSNSNIVIQLEVPTNISFPITLKLSKSS